LLVLIILIISCRASPQGVGRQAPELEISAAAGDQLIIIVFIELLL
jgi:hypothetical protein